MKKNFFLFPLLLLAYIPLFASGISTTPTTVIADKVKAFAFDLNQVQLLDGPFKHAQELERQFLLKTEIDWLLYPFRREAKLPNPVKGSDSFGWPTTGHMMGHYLSGCALMCRNTGDVELKKRADAAVAALAECQAAMKSGYLGGFPERSILHLERRVNDPAVRADVPWYCLHKIYAGLLDMYVLTGNQQALEVLEKAIDWAITNTDQLDEQQMQEMLDIEHGGMNELLANLYVATGKEKFLKLSLRFNHHKVLDPFAQNQDPLDGKHANTIIPKFTGVARQYQLTGDPALQKAATEFWNVVVKERSYVTGGNSAYELFSPKDRLSEYVHRDTTESCNEYNMLKLTRRLFCIEPRAEYADYYERTLLNHVLSTQHPVTGGQLYFQQLEAGSAKNGKGSPWGVPNQSRSCCQGTGLESHSKNADSIYFHDESNGLFVNLFIASVLDWKSQGVTLRQETRYPDEGSTRFVLACAHPVPLTLHIRRPWWATNGFQIAINGKKQELASTPGSYVALQRTWKTGDTVEVAMPMTLRVEGFKDNPKRVAVMYGPLVLAGMTEAGNRFSAIVTDDTNFLESLKPVEGKRLEFTAPASLFRTFLCSVGAEPVYFKPLFRTVDETYAVYWDLFNSKEFAELPTALQPEIARQKELEPKTVDLVLCFVNSKEFLESGKGTLQGMLLSQGLLPRTIQQVGEDSHAVKFLEGKRISAHKTGTEPEDMFPNLFRYPGDLPYRTRYIPGGDGWFSYEMQVLPGENQQVQIRLWHPDMDERGRPMKHVGIFDVLVDDRQIGTCMPDSLPFSQFVDVAYPIPMELINGKQRVTVTLRAKSPIRGFYECRIIQVLK